MPSSGSTLISLGGGTITLRDARRRTERVVHLSPFEIAARPVTRAEYARLAADHTLDSATAGCDDERFPVDGVSWIDAVQWCNRVSEAEGMRCAYVLEGSRVAWDMSANGFRLPTEAEWELACRAGTDGPTYGALADVAWTASDAVDGPQPVGTKAPNAHGLYDTLGNVWEWVWDYADPERYGDYRTLKGGGWADREWSCRVGVRRGSAPDARLEDVGFRVARGGFSVDLEGAAQGWSATADQDRASVSGPLPIGWTPLRDLIE